MKTEVAIKENDVTRVNELHLHDLHQQLMDTRDRILEGWEQQD